MSDELNRLKADLEVLERYQGYLILENARSELADKIARLEADEADPWREAKGLVEMARKFNAGLRTTWEQSRQLAEYIDHLTAENARLTARVAELEAAAKAEDDEDLHDAEKVLADMIPPFEGPIESIEPVLDPARVLATAAKWIDGVFRGRSSMSRSQDAIDFLLRNGGYLSQPYPMKGGEE